LKHSRLIVGKFLECNLLLVHNLVKAFVLEGQSLEHQALLVDESLQFLFPLPSVVFFTLDFVAGTDSSELGIFNFLRLRVKDFDQSSDHVIELHDLLKEVDALSF
jgi:hypothetical protein